MTRLPLKDFIIEFDFDGTIYKDQYPEIGAPIDGMKELINWCFSQGFIIGIWTCRAGSMMSQAIFKLQNDSINFDKINANAQYLIDYYKTDTRKMSCDLFIDDKNIGGVYHASELKNMIIEAWNLKVANKKLLSPVYVFQQVTIPTFTKEWSHDIVAYIPSITSGNGLTKEQPPLEVIALTKDDIKDALEKQNKQIAEAINDSYKATEVSIGAVLEKIEQVEKVIKSNLVVSLPTSSSEYLEQFDNKFLTN